MGTMTYDGWSIEFEDRLLAHLHLVVVQRFRNGQSFAMSWLNALQDGDGRSSIWMHPGGLYFFRFAGSRVPAIAPEWAKQLTALAQSSQGLIVSNEDGTLARSLSLRRLATS